jgi:3-hydroxybutyryl-CoA dehydrogenase
VHALGDLVSARMVVEAIVETRRQAHSCANSTWLPRTRSSPPTRSLSITALAAGMKSPDASRHAFLQSRATDAARGSGKRLATTPDVADTIYATALAWGKTPVHTQSTPALSSPLRAPVLR